MRLHEHKEVFAELIENAAEIIGLPQIYVEKDYRVTRALKCLSESECAEQAIFKGGTSLSKAYKLIHRFKAAWGHKGSYHDDPVGRLSNRIRHLYDICQIMKREEHQAFLEHPLGQAPLFDVVILVM